MVLPVECCLFPNVPYRITIFVEQYLKRCINFVLALLCGVKGTATRMPILQSTDTDTYRIQGRKKP